MRRSTLPPKWQEGESREAATYKKHKRPHAHREVSKCEEYRDFYFSFRPQFFPSKVGFINLIRRQIFYTIHQFQWI